MKSFIFTEYEHFRKKRHAKDCPALLWKFLEKWFKEKSVDINSISSAKDLFEMIYWELYVLKKQTTNKNTYREN